MSQLQFNTTHLLLSLSILLCSFDGPLSCCPDSDQHFCHSLSLNYLSCQCVTSPLCLCRCLLPPHYNSMWLVCCSLSCFLVALVSSLYLAIKDSAFAALCILCICISAFLLFSYLSYYWLHLIQWLQSLLFLMLLLHWWLLAIHAKFARSLCKGLCILVVPIVCILLLNHQTSSKFYILSFLLNVLDFLQKQAAGRPARILADLSNTVI